ncbi:hypothetical protein BpHYR1_007280 [Brachionus plicatilis]|uniref:Uncharacterized protein n=1 Tax=Brachionus plicatilis TaxID=10195 RepID=A0A3M7Q335_BRAPC|nr:hypothetical protein BpHYR1_007280 [Brachionus plicatilis]
MSFDFKKSNYMSINSDIYRINYIIFISYFFNTLFYNSFIMKAEMMVFAARTSLWRNQTKTAAYAFASRKNTRIGHAFIRMVMAIGVNVGLPLCSRLVMR